MEVRADYLQAVHDWSVEDSLEVPERAVEILAKKVREAHRAVTQMTPLLSTMAGRSLTETEAVYLVAQDRYKDFLGRLSRLSPLEASLLGRTIGVLELGPVSRECTLLFGVAEAANALQEAAEPPQSLSAQTEQNLRKLEAMFANLTPDHPMYARVQASIQEGKATLARLSAQK